MTQKRFESLLNGLFFLAVFICLLTIFIHERTFIDWRIPMLLGVIGFIIATILLWSLLKKRKIHWGMRLLFCVAYGAVSFYFAFFCLNYVFADNSESTQSFAIVDRWKGSRKQRTYVVVGFDSLAHTVYFPTSRWGELEYADSIQLTYSKGLFGFPVIRKKEIVQP